MSVNLPDEHILETSPRVASLQEVDQLYTDIDRIIHQVFDPLCARYSMDRFSLLILVNLYEEPEQNPLWLNFLFQVRPDRLSGSLRSLQYRKLISMGFSDADGGSRLVSLTDEGRALAPQVLNDLQATRATLEGLVSDEDQGEIREAWSTLCAAAAKIAETLGKDREGDDDPNRRRNWQPDMLWLAWLP